MTDPDAGDNAGSVISMGANPSSKPPISPAARKFAEHLARCMSPMIESAAKQQEAPRF
jgi:hypothetical protein